MGNENKPDFLVDSQGGASPEKINQLLRVLKLPDLFNGAGMSGERDGEKFFGALTSLIIEKKKELESLFFDEEFKFSMASRAIYEPTIRGELRKAVTKEGVRWDIFEGAWRRAFNLRFDFPIDFFDKKKDS